MATVAQVAGRTEDAVYFINLTYAALDRDAVEMDQSLPAAARPATTIWPN